MSVAVFGEFRLADPEMRFRQIIRERSQLTMKLEGTDVRTILIARRGSKCLRSRLLPRIRGSRWKLAARESCIRERGFCFETDILNVNVFCHKSFLLND